MKNTVKRMLSGVLAMSMVMGSSISVNAADLDTASEEVTVVSDTELPFIDVVVPIITPDVGEDGKPGNELISLNPFNLGGKGQIYTGEFTITNNSEVPLAVTFKDARVLTTVAENDAAISIVTKITDQTSKQAVVNLSYTDSTGKPVVKPLALASGTENKTGTDIAVTNPMTPLGGNVTYTITGTTTVSPTDAWSATDKITVVNAFSFTPQSFASYNIAKTAVLYSTDSSTVAVNDGETVELPKTILGDSKIEVPVVWVDQTDSDFDPDDESKWKKYDSSAPEEGVYTAMISQTVHGGKLSPSQIYTVASTVKMPTITVTKNADA